MSKAKRPRFRVGQVVCWINSKTLLRITRGPISIPNEKLPCYMTPNGYIPENFLRPLTEREAGRKPR